MKDKKGRDIVLSQREYFTVFDENIPVEKTWKDIEIISEEFANKLKEKYSFNYLEKIFNDLFRLNVNTKKNKNKPKYAKSNWNNLIEKSIATSINKVDKRAQDEVNFVVTVDPLFSISVDKGVYYNGELHTRLVEQFAEAGPQIFIVDELMYNSEWFQGLDLGDSEIRLFTKDLNLKVPLNVKKYNKMNFDLIGRKKGDKRNIYVLGGERVFKGLFKYVTDFYITFINDFESHGREYFTELPLHNLETVQCYVYDDLNMSHLRKYKGRQMKWKESNIKYSVLGDKY